MRTTLFTRALLAVVVVGLRACGGKDDKSSEAFCDQGRAIARATSDDAAGEAFQGAIDAAPAGVRDELTRFQQAQSTAAESEDDSGFLTDDFRAANNNALRAIAGACDFQSLPINAREYSFDGLGESVSAGTVAVHLKNVGAEVHDFLLYKRAKTTESDLVAVVDSDPSVHDGRLKQVGVALPMEAGQESFLLTQLSKGDYVAVCFVNQGMTSFAGFAQDAPAGAKAHRSLGMIKQFSVR